MGDASAGAGAWREGCGPASTRPHLRAPKPGAPWGQTPLPRPAPRPRNPPPPLRQPPPPRRRQRPHAKPLRSFRADSAEPRLPQAAARTTCSFPGRSMAATDSWPLPGRLRRLETPPPSARRAPGEGPGQGGARPWAWSSQVTQERGASSRESWLPQGRWVRAGRTELAWRQRDAEGVAGRSQNCP